MRTRIRTLAGIVALVALTFSVAETVWASMCGPAMGMADSAMVLDQGSSTDHHGVPDAPGEREPGGTESDCPFAPASLVQGCAASASLPAQVAGAPVPSPDAVASVFNDAMQQDLLLNTALFHPPRA